MESIDRFELKYFYISFFALMWSNKIILLNLKSLQGSVKTFFFVEHFLRHFLLTWKPFALWYLYIFGKCLFERKLRIRIHSMKERMNRTLDRYEVLIFIWNKNNTNNIILEFYNELTLFIGFFFSVFASVILVPHDCSTYFCRYLIYFSNCRNWAIKNIKTNTVTNLMRVLEILHSFNAIK